MAVLLRVRQWNQLLVFPQANSPEVKRPGPANGCPAQISCSTQRVHCVQVIR